MLDKWSSTYIILLITILKKSWKLSDSLANASFTENRLQDTEVQSDHFWYSVFMAELSCIIYHSTLSIKYIESLNYEMFTYAQYW